MKFMLTYRLESETRDKVTSLLRLKIAAITFSIG